MAAGACLLSGQTPADVRGALLPWTARASDPCEADLGTGPGEESVFIAAAAAVIARLNDGSDSNSLQARAQAALEQIENTSAGVNAAWPIDARFHFSLTPLAPALLVTMSFRTQGRFFLFGVPTKVEGKPNELWREVGSDDYVYTRPTPHSIVHIYSLQQGPKRLPRFLAAMDEFGCAGSTGIVYEVLSWNLGTFGLSKSIEQDGAFGLDQAADGRKPSRKDPFHPVGQLSTKGSRLTLPYCWFSALDWWDNPSLCAVDEYRIVGEDIVFRSRRYNHPELVPIARAYEYARAHELPAMLGYFRSLKIARRFLLSPPVLEIASDPQIRWLAPGRARITLETSAQFEVQQRHGRWIIVAFRPF
ncbi:MAG: hypothetical protein ACRYFU_21900 [Janthinobacterium lividum]